jgi:uncharacterized protein YbcI
VICILEGTLTPVEQTLAAEGEHQQLQNIRQFFQATMKPAFREAIERITGRRVVSYMSGKDIEHDIASEIFILAPEPK